MLAHPCRHADAARHRLLLGPQHPPRPERDRTERQYEDKKSITKPQYREAPDEPDAERFEAEPDHQRDLTGWGIKQKSAELRVDPNEHGCCEYRQHGDEVSR